MRRHQIGIVIGALGLNVVTARRLHADYDIAEPMQAEAELAVGDMRVLLHFAPSRLNCAPYIVRQRGERSLVICQRPRHTTDA